ncbi:hypothetical protein V8J88_20285 [Massilia sp. W12]|uniref:hypothetical protein n=1 Tax=Massilia sp. W12 TaxID=3126507 RepID=UPI0030D3AAB6
MLQGVHLTLLIGPQAPLPAPPLLMEALSGVRVTQGGSEGAFELSFALGKQSPILQQLLPAGFFDPIVTRVILMVTLQGAPQVLIDGVITRHQLQAGEQGLSTLTLTGSDLSVLMDVVEVRRVFQSTPHIAQAAQILANYAAFGIVPLLIPPLLDQPLSPSQGREIQYGTDLDWLRSLARRHAYVFYLEPGPLPGSSRAYFGPPLQDPSPQPALSVNMDAHSNVESLSASYDGLSKKILVFGVLDPATGTIPLPLPLPNLNIYRPPLGACLTPPAKVEFSPSYNRSRQIPNLLDHILGTLAQSSQALRLSGSLHVSRYGGLLRARRLVGVRGLGLAHDGLYYVDSVTHDIKPGEYKQSFELSRDGLISLTPTVPI